MQHCVISEHVLIGHECTNCSVVKLEQKISRDLNVKHEFKKKKVFTGFSWKFRETWQVCNWSSPLLILSLKLQGCQHDLLALKELKLSARLAATSASFGNQTIILTTSHSQWWAFLSYFWTRPYINNNKISILHYVSIEIKTVSRALCWH